MLVVVVVVVVVEEGGRKMEVRTKMMTRWRWRYQVAAANPT